MFLPYTLCIVLCIYHRHSGEDDVPSNKTISRSLSRNKRKSSAQTTIDLPRKSTLSLQRPKRPQSDFKKRTKKRAKLDHSFYPEVNNNYAVWKHPYTIWTAYCVYMYVSISCPSLPECWPKEFRRGGTVWV